MLYRVAPWAILFLSFAILAISYDTIPDEVLIARNLDGSNPTIAPKSLFTVFRVPLIEVVCALVVELMRRKSSRSDSEIHANYRSMWSILLYTVAFKSLFQTFEDVSPKNFSHIFFYITFGVVIIGIILALLKNRKFFSAFSRADWKFSLSEKLVLMFLLVVYLGLAFVPILIFS